MKNVDVNLKNLLPKVYAIKDLFGILVIVNVNVINHVTQDKAQIIKNLSTEKKIVDNLVGECSENIDEKK